MRAQVIAIESGTQYTDGLERLVLRFEDADGMFDRIRLRQGVIDWTQPLRLGDQIELTVARAEPDSIQTAIGAVGKAKAKIARHES